MCLTFLVVYAKHNTSSFVGRKKPEWILSLILTDEKIQDYNGKQKEETRR